MRRGAWHQCGHNSQKLVDEQLQQKNGVGVILSPRDLSRDNALAYAAKYRAAGSELVIDQQYHIADYSNDYLESYPITRFRKGVSTFKISDEELQEFMKDLHADHAEMNATALIAPAVMYEAGRQDIIQLNGKLFDAAKKVAEALKIPTYASVVFGRSVTSSDKTIQAALSQATSLQSDGWYFGYEFEEERIPSARDAVMRCSSTVLTLACTGKPVLHAYAGPMGLISLGSGATGVALGHSQNLWKFDRARWMPAQPGGGGDAPRRFFSSSLWGTIVYPDELVRLSPALRAKILTHTAFSAPVKSNAAWSRGEAGKHLVCSMSLTYDQMAKETDAKKCAAEAINILKGAVALHKEIEQENVFLKDNTSSYQENWHVALQQSLVDNKGEYGYLDLLS